MRTFQRILNCFFYKPKTRISLALFYLTILLFGAYLFYNRNSNDLYELEKLIEKFGIEPKHNIIKIKPYCKCRQEILVKEYYDNIYVTNKAIIYYNGSLSKLEAEKQLVLVNYLKSIFNIPSKNVIANPKFTCNLYSELRHGPGQKVISYSLYGTHLGYYNLIDTIANMSLEFFDDWIIRVHYDNSIKKDIICNMECKHDHIYFCNVQETPFKNVSTINLFKPKKNQVKLVKNDMGYIHGMMWRWFPITDDFIDYYNSRDSDSTLIQRERDSVDAWLKGSKLFHIIRDNPYHNVFILGGLWGHANVRSRQSGYDVYQTFIEKQIQDRYNHGDSNPKNLDQTYLSEKVWPIASKNATIHDAYNCKFLGGEPFPTQRPPNLYCFISCFFPCCKEIYNQTHRMAVCPQECRPKDHPEWERC